MTDSRDAHSPLESAAGAAGPHATEAFSVVSNETRVSILLALWEAFEPLSEENAVTFSGLRASVGMRDSGRFNYHLDQLTDHFVRRTDAGYELRNAGQKLVRTIIAGTGLGETTVPPTDLDLSCHRCGAHPVELRYEAETLYLRCTDCEGFITFEDYPRGTLAVWNLDPAGIANRTPPEIFVAGAIAENTRLRTMIDGVCPDCSGVIETSVRLCEEHLLERGDVCPTCGTRDEARVRYVCAVCKNWNEGPIQVAIHDHPAVISFYYDHGIDITYDIDDIEGFYRTWNLLWAQEQTVISTDPVRIRVTVPCEGETLSLSLDENANVRSVREDR